MRNMRSIVHAGQLDRKVQLYKYTTTKNDAGDTIQAETFVANLYAKRDDSPGSEDDDDGRVIGLGNAAFTIRMRKDILTDLQSYYIKDLDGLFQIYSVEITGQQHRFLTLKASRRGSES